MFDDEKELSEQNDAVEEHNEQVEEQQEEVVEQQEQNDSVVEDDSEQDNASFLLDDTDDKKDNYYGYTNNSAEYNQQQNEEKSYYNYNSNNMNYNENMYDNDPNKKKKTIAIIAAIATVAVISVIGIGIATKGIMDNVDDSFEKIEETTPAETVEYPTIGSTSNENNNQNQASTSNGIVITDVSGVVENCMPSIVSITSTTIVESTDWNSFFPFYGYDEGSQEYEEQVGAGSGIIVKQTDKELLIVTNNHVIAGADSLSIQFVDGKSIEGITKSTDEEADIAIVSIPLEDIDADTMKAIKIATLGSSDDIRVGEGVIAIGNALGYGQSVTTGVISAKERQIAVDNRTMVVLQTDAAINGGNSGGALINSKGEVIGINVAKYSSSSYSGAASVEGMGFAIPVSQATDIINNLMDRETREKVDPKDRGVIGIQGFTVTSTDAEKYKIPLGIYINSIVEGGAADKAGLKASDVITKFDGLKVPTMESLQDKLQYYKAGEKITITISRNTNSGYQERDVEITLSPASVNDKAE